MRNTIVNVARAGSVASGYASSQAFVCRECLARSAVVSAPGQRRTYAAERRKNPGLLDSETWRKKIWGTDSPPGAKDPYGPSQLFPKTNKPEETDAEEQEIEDARQFEGSSVEQAKEFDSEYVPADTWDGVDRIGGPTGWWEKVWDADNQFKGWAAPPMRNLTDIQASSYVHRAFVEATVLQEAGLDLDHICDIPSAANFDYNQILLNNAKPGTASLKFPDQSWRQEIIEAASSDVEYVEEETDVTTPTSAEAEAVVEDLAEPVVNDTELPAVDVFAGQKTEETNWLEQSAWRHIQLDDALKFAVVKRVMQLTGVRIPDNVLNNQSELGMITKAGFPYQPPRNLSKELLEREKGIATKYHQPVHDWNAPGNVTVHAQRQTFIDREMKVGRWKEIRKQLRRQGLPVPSKKRAKS